MKITLKCNCTVDGSGTFTVSEQCKNCVECNTVSQLHPFGIKRLPPKSI